MIVVAERNSDPFIGDLVASVDLMARAGNLLISEWTFQGKVTLRGLEQRAAIGGNFGAGYTIEAECDAMRISAGLQHENRIRICHRRHGRRDRFPDRQRRI